MKDMKLGINLGFAINRYPEPEVWARIVREDLGLGYVQFVADLLNPFLPADVINSQLARIKEACRRYELVVDTTFTSAFTRVNHLMNPDPELRRVWVDWFKRWAEISAELGARGMGSHFGILTVADCEDPVRYALITSSATRSWQELTRHCAGLGMEFLIFEPMSVPREMGWTMDESAKLLEAVNSDAAIPMQLCLDLGHAPHPKERDPFPWLERFANVSPVIHLQQTEYGHSRHWPFTDEYNSKGIVDADRVLDILEEKGLEGVFLGFEISHRERWPDEKLVIPDLAASARHWQTAMDKRRGR